MADPQTELPQAPDPYANHDAIRTLVTKRLDEWKKGRETFVRAAYRNILFFQGVQWINWDRRINRFRPSILTKGTPTPVTNKFAETVDALISVFARIEPRLHFAPGSPNEPEDRAAADVASRAIAVVEDEVSIRTTRQALAGWVGLTGGAWRETGYDPDPVHGTRELIVEQCDGCGAEREPEAPSLDLLSPCPECGGQYVQATETVPRGKMYSDVVPIFEMYFDSSVTEWSRQKACLREKTVSEDAAKSRWPHLKESIQPNVVSGMDEWYGEALPTIGPALDDGSTQRFLVNTSRQVANRVTERWYWQLPDETYPDGLLAILLGRETVAFAGPLPYGARQADGSKQPFLPFVYFPQKRVPGSAYPKTVANDLALLQADRNRWQSIIKACGMRMGSPVWMVPTAANIQAFSGESGAVHRINWQQGMPHPSTWRIPGQPIPMSFMQQIQMIDKDFEAISGIFDVLKGARPEGVSAGIALQILQERGMSRFGPLFIEWEYAHAEWARQALEIAREYWTEERFRKIQGRDGQWEVEKFVGADLQGQVDVIPEAGSSMPRSTLAERAEIEQLIALGVVNRADPETAFKILEKYGHLDLIPSMQADTKKAIMENEAFAQMATDPRWQTASPDDVAAMEESDWSASVEILRRAGIDTDAIEVWGAIDGHAIHSKEHGAFLKSERALQLPKIIRVVAAKHKEWHDILMIHQAQALQGIQQPANPMAGFLARPGPRVQPMNTSSSPERMEGDFGELERDGAASATG